MLEKNNGKGAVREGRGFTLLISNEDMDDIIEIVESVETSGLEKLMVELKQ